jgi:RNA polymerase sigma-70 factor (ECF subfamily)
MGNFWGNRLSNGETVFEAWMRRDGAKIYNLALKLSGNIVDGQDLAQETFIKAYEHFSDFRGEAEINTWAYRICVNLWKNRLRSQKRRFFWRHISLSGNAEGDDKPVFELPDPKLATDRPLEDAERHSLVRDALGRLEKEDRTILVLRDMEDKSYEDIASFLELPLGTVKSRLARARDKLKVLLKPYMDIKTNDQQ